jgi:zinc protease
MILNDHITALKEESTSLDDVARQAFFSTVYGNHPYGHIVEGNVSSLQNIAPKMIKDFYQLCPKWKIS